MLLFVKDKGMFQIKMLVQNFHLLPIYVYEHCLDMKGRLLYLQNILDDSNAINNNRIRSVVMWRLG